MKQVYPQLDGFIRDHGKEKVSVSRQQYNDCKNAMKKMEKQDYINMLQYLHASQANIEKLSEVCRPLLEELRDKLATLK